MEQQQQQQRLIAQLRRENELLRQQLAAQSSSQQRQQQQQQQQQEAPPAAAAAACPADSGGAASSAHAFAAAHGLSKAQVERYSRHLLLPSFGVAAQGALCAARVLVVGCGGLGSPAVLYLAAAGVGTLGLVDHDVVELSNMHRQVIHSEARLGQHKARSAAATVAALNSGVAVATHADGLTPANAFDIVSRYDVVLDGSDNPPTRYLLNDACVAAGKPLVSAAAVGTDGQLTVLNAGPGCPCYRCLFPECPAPANCARCADAGVLGPVPGVLGVLQALEAIKVATRVGEPLAGRLLLFDALAGRFTTIKLRGRAPGCIACGEAAQLTDASSIASYDYAGFTGGQAAGDGPPPALAVLPPEQRLSAAVLAAQLRPRAAASVGEQPEQQEQEQLQQQLLLLDVRPPEQFGIMALPGAVNMPYLQLEQRLPEVLGLCGLQQQPQAGAACNGSSGSVRRVVVMCRRGNHSQLAVQRLRQAGLSDALDVIGGYEAWAAQVEPGMPVL